MPELSVVIVNYNTRDKLEACLNSLIQEQVHLSLEIIVVDNASTDHSAQMVRERFPQVILLAEPRNTWFCGGNNLGSQRASADYVLLLNPDTVVREGALSRLLGVFRAHPELAGVTAQLIYPDGRGIQRTCSRIPTFTYLFLAHTPFQWVFRGAYQRAYAHHWYDDWQRNTDLLVEAVPGSCTLTRKGESWLDEDLLLYFPEETLGRTLSRPFLFVADSIIEHHEKSATQSWLATQIYFRDLFVYTRKYHGIGAMGALWVASRPLYFAQWFKQWLKQR